MRTPFVVLIFIGLALNTNVLAQMDHTIPLRAVSPPVRLQSPAEAMLRAQAIRAAQAQAEQTAAQTRLIQEQTRALQQQNNERASPVSNQSQPQQPAPPDPAVQQWLTAAQPRMHLFPDFEQVVFSPNLLMSIDMVRLMSGSQYAADIAYYFGKHPVESSAVAQMPLLEAARAINDIEQRLKGQP